MTTLPAHRSVERPNLADRIQRAAEISARKGLARRIAAALMQRMQIPAHGADLAYWIGGADSRSNGAAITQWVEARLEECQRLSGAEPRPGLDVLADQLSRRLEQLRDATSS